jgi:PEP-CTERM motif
MKLKKALLLCSLFAVSLVPTLVNASIAGDTFQGTIKVEGGINFEVGPFPGTAGAVDDEIRSTAADLRIGVTQAGSENEFAVNWVDEDSFEFLYNAFGAVDVDLVSFILSDLNFTTGGQPRDIASFVFNRAASDVDSYEAGPALGDPTVSFTANSVTATFGFFSKELAADGPIFRFDVTLVPEPTSLFLLSGLGALCLRRRTARIE